LHGFLRPTRAVGATVKINQGEIDLTTAGQTVRRDETDVTRTDANEVLAHVDKAGTVVVVELVISWTLKVLVYDCGQPEAGALAALRAQTPVHIQSELATRRDPRTGDDGAAFVDPAMLFATAYTVSIPDTERFNKEHSTAQVKINGTPVNVATVDRPVTSAGGTVTRTATNAISLTALATVEEIEITFRLFFVYRLHVKVLDVTPKADGAPMTGNPIPLKTVPVTLEWGISTDAARGPVTTAPPTSKPACHRDRL